MGIPFDLAQAVSDFKKIFSAPNPQIVVSIPDALATVQKLSQIAISYNLLGLQDICQLICADLADKLYADEALSIKAQQSFAGWAEKLSEYLNSPYQQETVQAFLSACPVVIDDDRTLIANMLLLSEATVLTESVDGSHEKILAKLTNIAFADTMATEQTQKFMQYLHALTESFEERDGCHDVCIYLQHNMHQWLIMYRVLPAESQKLLQTWLDNIKLYLHDPTSQHAHTLLETMTAQHWAVSLTDKSMAIIADRLGHIIDQQDIDETMGLSEQDPKTIIYYLDHFMQLLERLAQGEQDSLILIDQQLKKIATSAQQFGSLGLHDLCFLLSKNLDLFRNKNTLPTEEQIDLLKRWGELAKAVVLTPTNQSLNVKLLAIVQEPCWQQILPEVDIEILKQLLSSQQTLAKISDQEDIALVSSKIIKSQYDLKNLLEIFTLSHAIAPSIISTLQGELDKDCASISDAVDKIDKRKKKDPAWKNLLHEYINILQKFSDLFAEENLHGLCQCNVALLSNINALVRDNIKPSTNLCAALPLWLECLSAYLSNVGNNIESEVLIDLLKEPFWSEPLEDDIAIILSNLLTMPYIDATDVAPAQPKPSNMLVADLSLDIPADTPEAIVAGLLQELPEQVEVFSRSAQAMLTEQCSLQNINNAQRIVHTIKGAANTVGISGLALFAHHLEDIFEFFSEHKKLPSINLANIIIAAADCLEDMCEALLQQADPPQQAAHVLQKIIDHATSLAAGETDSLGNDISITSATIVPPASRQDESEENNKKLSISVAEIDDLLYLIGENIALNTQLEGRLNIMREHMKEIYPVISHFKSLMADFHRELDVHNYADMDSSAKSLQSNILNIEKHTEINTWANQLLEKATDIMEFSYIADNNARVLAESFLTQAHCNLSLHDKVMKIRMVPIRHITSRLERSVRQTCKSLHKDAQLILQGIDTLIDTDVLNNLLQPLMHIIRNAVDHGIEDKATRIAKGKPIQGKIELKFFREGEQLVVICQDDGRGIDTEQIKALAMKNGLLSKTDELSSKTLQSIIMKPGFSTCTEITQTSGRGIGLDAVQTEIVAAKGSVWIHSKPGQGCTVELRLPVTLMTVYAFVVKENNKIFTISSHCVERIVLLDNSILLDTKDGLRRQINDEVFEVYSLSSLLNEHKKTSPKHISDMRGLLLKQQDRKIIITVDDIIDSRYLILKTMGQYLSHIKGVMGAAIIGDGSVSVILDLTELLKNINTSPLDEQIAETVLAVEKLPLVLIVDDSPSSRRILKETIESVGYNSVVAKNGEEALALVVEQHPDIILTDLEMPIMNGVELAFQITANPETKHIPIIMISSKLNDKSKKMAAKAGVRCYICKPLIADELLENIQILLAEDITIVA